jgi:multimeric flavodoxin WrbA
MKVLLVNGSPHAKGCTYTALTELAGALGKQGIETEIFQVGTKAISGCLGCGACEDTGRCFINDPVNEFLDKALSADGFIFGSPVHYASASGMLTSFMDRVFYANNMTERFAYKPAAAIVSARRAGTTATFDQINKYFAISNMPIVSSQYWNMVHGSTPEDVKKDLEGLQIMRTLGNNMAWILKSIEAGKAAGVSLPKREKAVHTNFIR